MLPDLGARQLGFAVRRIDEAGPNPAGGDVTHPAHDGEDRADGGASSLRDRLSTLARQHGLLDLYVFGSRAEEIAARVRGGEGGLSDEPSVASPESDVDIAVRPRRDAPFDVDARVELTQALEELFGVSRVDLVVLPEAGAFLAEAAIGGELLFCEDTTDQAEYELYVLRRAGDLLPFERERRELILKHGAR